MARTDYGAILSTVIKDTSDAIREVNDTSALIAPNAWGANIRTMHSDADYETALSYIPTKTVSGAIASFNDGAGGLDLKSLKVAITAKQSGSGTPSPDNIRPISGVSECNVVRCGKNLWSNEKAVADSNTSIVYIEDGVLNFKSGPNPLKYYLKCNSQVVLSCKLKSTVNTNVGFRAYYSDGTNTQILSVTLTANVEQSVTTIATTSGKELAYISSMYTDDRPVMMWDAQLELGSTATDYEAYTGNTYTIQLGDIYYGGSLDVTNGVLTITHKYIEYDGSEDENWVYQNNGYTISRPTGSAATSAASMCYSNQAVRTGDTSMPNGTIRIGASNVVTRLGTGNNDVPTYKAWLAEHPLQLVYPLATPITVQLTPTQVEQLLGVNNVWADCGDITECVYYSTESGGVTSVEGSYQRTDATGVSSVPRLIYTYTATEDCTMCFCGTIATDTSQSQGYLKMVVNDSDEYRTAGLVQYNETPFSLDNISLQSGDTVKFYGDWEGSHSGCFFHLRLSMVKAV